MWNTLLFTAVIVTLTFVLLGIRILVVKNGKFPDMHIGANGEMRKRGISCALSTDAKDRNRKQLSDIYNETENFKK